MLSLNSDRYLEYLAGGAVGRRCAEPRATSAGRAPEIVYSLDDSGTTVLLVDDSFRPAGRASRPDVPSFASVVYCGDGDVPAGMLSLRGSSLAEAAPVRDARAVATISPASSTPAAPPAFPRA